MSALKTIEAPALSTSYGQNVKQTFDDIQTNFDVLANRELYKGDTGRDLVTVNVPWSTVFTEDSSNPGHYVQNIVVDGWTIENFADAIKTALGLFTSDPDDVTAAIDGLVNGGWAVTVCFEETENVAHVLSSVPFVYVDFRFRQNLTEESIENLANKTDMSCTILCNGDNNGVGVWSCTQNFPTLYYSDGELYWIINGQKTQIIARGPKGTDGSTGQVYVGLSNFSASDVNNIIAANPGTTTTLTISYLLAANISPNSDTYTSLSQDSKEHFPFITISDYVSKVETPMTAPIIILPETPITIPTTSDQYGYAPYFIGTTVTETTGGTTTVISYVQKYNICYAHLNDNIIKQYMEGKVLELPASGQTLGDGELTGLAIKRRGSVTTGYSIFVPNGGIMTVSYVTDTTNPAVNTSSAANSKIRIAMAVIEGEASSASIGDFAHAEGNGSNASGDYSHAEGSSTASGNYSHAEGDSTASGVNAHSEGDGSTAYGSDSHAEGHSTLAKGSHSHAEGDGGLTNLSGVSGNNTIYTKSSHGLKVGNILKYNNTYAYVVTVDNNGFTTNTPLSSSALNNVTIQIVRGVAWGDISHTEGNGNTSSGEASHAEGTYTIAYGDNSHAEGSSTQANGDDSHAEGSSTRANGEDSHAEGYNTLADGEDSHAEGNESSAEGTASHAEGTLTRAQSLHSHAEGYKTHASGNGAHAEGYANTSSKSIKAQGNGSHAEGCSNNSGEIAAIGNGSHAGGYTDTGTIKTESSAQGSSATGFAATGGSITTKSNGAHAEGFVSSGSIQAAGRGAHAEGYTASGSTIALGDGSHAEGRATAAVGDYSHAEGRLTTAGATVLDRDTPTSYKGCKTFHIDSVSDTNATLNTSGSTATLTFCIEIPQSTSAANISISGTTCIARRIKNMTNLTSIGSLFYNKTWTCNSISVVSTGSYGGTYYAKISMTAPSSGPQYSEWQGDNVAYVINQSTGYYISFNSITIDGVSYVGGPQYISYKGSENTHTEGKYTCADGDGAHAEGYGDHNYPVIALGIGAHAEGRAWDGTIMACGNGAHAEGYADEDGDIIAYGSGAHAEGEGTIASGSGAHAEGAFTKAIGQGAHASGYYTKTSDSGFGECAMGIFNAPGYAIPTSTTGGKTSAFLVKNSSQVPSGYSLSEDYKIIFSIGCGTSDSETGANHRTNALFVTKNGHVFVLSRKYSYNNASTYYSSNNYYDWYVAQEVEYS